MPREDDRGTPAPVQEPAEAVPALCPLCSREVPVMEALVYHGVVYHPACALPEGTGNRQQGTERKRRD